MSKKFIVIGLTQPEFEPARFGLPNIPEWETDALLIWPPHPVWCDLTLDDAGMQNSNNQPTVYIGLYIWMDILFLLLFYVLATSKVISGRVRLVTVRTHGDFYSAASLGGFPTDVS